MVVKPQPAQKDHGLAGLIGILALYFFISFLYPFKADVDLDLDPRNRGIKS